MQLNQNEERPVLNQQSNYPHANVADESLHSSPRRHRIKRKMVNKSEMSDTNARKENQIEMDN